MSLDSAEVIAREMALDLSYSTCTAPIKFCFTSSMMRSCDSVLGLSYKWYDRFLVFVEFIIIFVSNTGTF